jgi:hypothetical protein
MDIQKDEQHGECYKCKIKKPLGKLKKCNSCGAIFCTPCAINTFLGPELGGVREIPKGCIKCDSEDVIDLRHIKKK